MRQLTVFTRRGCHLCTDMLQALECLRPRLGFAVTTVDIDKDPGLVSRYNTRVPVLVIDEVEVCYYVLEEDRLREHLQASDCQ